MPMRQIPGMLLLACLTLAACQPIEPQSGSVPAADASTASVPSMLTGEYRVAGIDGQDVGGGIGIALIITDDQIWFDPRCAGFSWTYTHEDGALTTDRPESPRAVDGQIAARLGRPTCRIAVHPEQRRLANALDAVRQVRRTPSNGIEMSGGGHSVTLFTQ